MLVSHTHRFIYTKTVKTAGTSVEAYFEPLCMPPGTWDLSGPREETVTETGIVGYRGPTRPGTAPVWYNHMPAAEIRTRLGSETWNAYFKFCVIRNPFDKAVSAFHFWDRERSARAARQGPEALRELFSQWAANPRNLPVDRNQYVLNEQICVDFFIRQENLDEGVREVCERINAPFEPDRIPRLKSASRPKGIPLENYYTPQTVDAVANIYQFEINHFGYTTPAV